MSDNDNPLNKNTKRAGIINWLKLQILGDETDVSPVDTQFITDLSDIRTVGRYEIIGRLGKGSMGVVYLGRDPYIDRKVSIKISRPSSDVLAEQADKYRERFFVEAQSAGRLMHNNIVAIYDAGMYKDFCYITMEYIDGPTLVRFSKKDSLLPVSKTIEIIFTVCKALEFAHKQGVIHRDVKPSNIMLTKAGDVKITDFSIAHIKSEEMPSKGIRLRRVMRVFIIILIFFGFLISHVVAGEVKEIELSDGSVIFGEIVTLEEGIYTIKTTGLGTVHIEKSKIRAIRLKSNTETTREQLKALEQRMLNDDEILTMLHALESDPAFKEIMEDPEIMNGVLSGDIPNLMSNPKFMKLLDNPKVQEIRRRIQE